MPNFLEQFVKGRNARRDVSHIEIEVVKGESVNVYQSEVDKVAKLNEISHALFEMSRRSFLSALFGVK
jgi:hypothetical protein